MYIWQTCNVTCLLTGNVTYLRNTVTQAVITLSQADENYRKADADLHLSRVEVEKQKTNASIKSRQCDEAKNEYASQLQKTNKLQVFPIC